MKLRSGSNQRTVVAGVAATIATAVAYIASGLSAGCAVPLSTQGDAASGLAAAKAATEGGGMYTNPWLGAPGTQEMFDYPQSDLLNAWMLAGITNLVGHPVSAVNLFYVATFALAAASAAIVAMELGLWPSLAVLVGAGFALLPYHFARSVGHLFLSNYCMVPVAVLMASQLMGPMPLDCQERGPVSAFHWRMLPSAVMCIIIGSTGIYYAVFSCLLYCVGAAYGWRKYGLRNVYAMLALIGLTGCTAIAQGLPMVVYRVREGINCHAVERSRGGGELYGFRLGQLVLPAANHRVPRLQAIGITYDQVLKGLGFPANEGHDFAALGIFAALGFLACFPAILLTLDTQRGAGPVAESFFHRLSILGVAVFLLGIGGGLGSLLCIAFPLIRAYERISVFAGFIGLVMTSGLIMLIAGKVSPARSRVICTLLSTALLPLVIFDQVPLPRHDRLATETEWKSLGEFVRQVESAVPARAMIFQLPYVPFPEHPPVNRMWDYDHLKPYLHSHRIHWSYGAIKGRKVAEWQRKIASLEANEMVNELRKSGFHGIWIDRYGYPDSGQDLERCLSTALGSSPFKTSEDGRYCFCRLE